MSSSSILLLFSPTRRVRVGSHNKLWKSIFAFRNEVMYNINTVFILTYYIHIYNIILYTFIHTRIVITSTSGGTRSTRPSTSSCVFVRIDNIIIMMNYSHCRRRPILIYACARVTSIRRIPLPVGFTRAPCVCVCVCLSCACRWYHCRREHLLYIII